MELTKSPVRRMRRQQESCSSFLYLLVAAFLILWASSSAITWNSSCFKNLYTHRKRALLKKKDVYIKVAALWILWAFMQCLYFFTSLLLYFFTSLLLYFFASLLHYFFTYLLLYFFTSLFPYVFTSVLFCLFTCLLVYLFTSFLLYFTPNSSSFKKKKHAYIYMHCVFFVSTCWHALYICW